MSNTSKPTIVAFDFDGTITNKDSFFQFIQFSRGKARFYLGFMLFTPILVAMKLHLISNWKVKQMVISHFFKGISLQQFNAWGEQFSKNIDEVVRPKFAEVLEKYKQANCEICIVSASVENWLQPWATKMGISTVLATQLEVNNEHIITGKLQGKNCYRQEKVNRLIAQFPNHKNYHIIAYGDSTGDKEMLRFANEAHLRALE